MASPVADAGLSQQHPLNSAAGSAFQEAQKWIEAATGRSFGDKDFRGNLENGIFLCELLSSIKPGLVKKINRLPTPIAGLDNLTAFLRGCEELGLKGSQLFDPGDLQDTSTRPTAKGSDCSRRLKNVLITVYWLGRAANSFTSYSGPTLDLKEFEALLSQMQKEAEVTESPSLSIRDSGYIDCWDSERSDSLSPPRHGREDSFDSLDSFGSRSQQTPSPDVLAVRGSSDGRGSDSESDGLPNRKMPDIHKDDMLARRTSVTELRTAMPFNQYLPNKSNQSGYVPLALRKKKNNKEADGGGSWSTTTSPVGGSRPCSTPARSCSEELLAHSASVVTNNTINAAGGHQTDTHQQDAGGAGAKGGDTLAFQSLALTTSDFSVLPSAMATTSTGTSDTDRQKGMTLSERDDGKEEKPWLDFFLPATSMSMVDMHGEENRLQPHSQVRHEQMLNQYNQMKEEESHWQDDLARWKSRRRSISQDLIKKEEERKLMEQLLTGHVDISQRRRSIKTYREIVQDKEQREEELRLAYKQAKTPEEASAILHRYAQRFSVSEAVLERLQLPKLLDRSVSADPSFPISLSASPTTPDPFDEDPDGPLKYLRQHSAPTPKFTSTLEARIEEIPKEPPSQQRLHVRSRSSEPPSTRALSPKAVPLLSPKPYIQFRPAAAETRDSKTGRVLQVNGEDSIGAPHMKPQSEERETPHFQASPSSSGNKASDTSTHSDEGGRPSSTTASLTSCCSEAATQDIRQEHAIERSTPPSRPTSLPEKLQTPDGSFVETVGHPNAPLNTTDQQAPPAEAKQEQQKTELTSENLSSLIRSEMHTQKNKPKTAAEPSQTETKLSLEASASFGYQPSRETPADFEISVRSLQATSNPKLRWEFFALSEDAEKDQCKNVSVPVFPQAKREDRWSWDPDEERKRQERWQQEQEHMLQEKYQREQEKLKEEWEKAQREVMEEERKYREEERRILEETVMPLTPRSSALPSPSRGELMSSSGAQDTIFQSQPEREHIQEVLEGQTRTTEENRRSDISTAEESSKAARSLVSQNSSQAESSGRQTPFPAQSSAPVKTPHVHTADSSRPSRPAGEQRNDLMGSSVGHSSPKPPAAADAQPPAPSRSVSGKKLCSSCTQPLGKGAAMIIETLSLYFHIHCFKCGLCKGQLGDTTTGTDVRIRNGLLNCHQCYIRSRSAGQPTTL
ncbi:LIM and calponin homology domains-containing protein 1 isoform X3 [Oryzias latipes]|uniref:LIM and calponin homology domains-containing protein 1 isoform X3 n=1 Tax=Oryzias latipes TaxID=8090 RepID=UPI000CE1FEC9|nr:LIM and calponin homology domains-containing protein 1 isoform X3 [Oryzias latipes]